MIGCGYPVALHISVTSDPSSIVCCRQKNDSINYAFRKGTMTEQCQNTCFYLVLASGGVIENNGFRENVEGELQSFWGARGNGTHIVAPVIVACLRMSFFLGKNYDY